MLSLETYENKSSILKTNLALHSNKLLSNVSNVSKIRR